MHPQTQLTVLINSLSAKEKSAFFKRENAVFAENKHASLLSRKPSLSRSEILKKLKLSKKGYKKFCESTYTQLCHFLLSDKGFLINDIPYNLRENQMMAELLKERGLIAEAKKKIEKAIEIAMQSELFSNEISLRHQYLQIMFYQQEASSHDKILPFLQRMESIIAMQREQEELKLIYRQLITLRYKMALRTSLEEQEEVKLLDDQLKEFLPESLRSNTASIYYYQSCLLVSFMLGRTANISGWNNSLLEHWEQQSHLIPLHQDLFVRAVSLQAYTQFLIKDIAGAKAFLERYRDLATKHLLSVFYQDWFAIVDFQTITKVLHKTYQYEELENFFSKKWELSYKQLPVLGEAEKLDVLMSVCITFFVLQQWQNAETIILEIKANNQKIKRIDTLYFTFVFHSLILYEQKEWSRLDSHINSGYHFLYSNNALRPFEKDMLLFIKKLPVAMLKGKAKEIMNAFLHKLDAYRDNETQKLHFATFDYYSWIESKIEEVSYITHMKRKALNQQTTDRK